MAVMPTLCKSPMTMVSCYLDIFPPGILSFGNLAKDFWAAGFVREFQCFAASSMRCKLCEPFCGKCFPADVVNDMLRKGVCMQLDRAAVMSTREKRRLDVFFVVVTIVVGTKCQMTKNACH